MRAHAHAPASGYGWSRSSCVPYARQSTSARSHSSYDNLDDALVLPVHLTPITGSAGKVVLSASAAFRGASLHSNHSSCIYLLRTCHELQ
jgi:hypothetical protein